MTGPLPRPRRRPEPPIGLPVGLPVGLGTAGESQTVRVAQLWRYPVKSLGGERLDEAEIGPLGLDGDRRWGIRDLGTGKILTARRQPEMLFARASVADGGLRIVLPDGRTATDDRELSKWLGRPVQLVAAGDTGEGGTYEAPLDADSESDWVSWQGPPGAWHDSGNSRVSLLSTATIGSQDPRRFRPNILLDGSDEDRAVGSTLAVGGCLLEVRKQISRCVMVTRPQPGLERDLGVLRRINRERDGKLAVGATVVRPGSVSVGDPVNPLP